ncbi:molybdenum cofactor biosynthesis protein MoaE [Allopontixanthobacter sediminis]|uniref:Molybdopterin synthase catalytic subunit n=1 Tax=Allopontixanthobacter sediminis TaxID=1689985 RepID=A0A845B511_9SPHN|nr:molybdenum cofactor biosynthesis protein MoaE [Allopontixanthobacter sediminis]MXP45460.1 molybdenum cofactor biosynthesis protein MoaE [Allopontixanthobacter sediminis]
MRDIRLIDRPFIPGTLIDPFTQANPGLGGVCTFVGEVRAEGGVEALELTHYEPLTLPGMNALADRACARFDLMGLLMVHRIGMIRPGEPIVCVSAAARHRRDAIDTVDFVMDHLKSAAWFWKREKRANGWHWIEPRAEDHADLARWKMPHPE